MTLAIYDIATLGARKKAERILREMNFVFLFGNARWVSRPVDVATLSRRLRSTLRGESFRVLLVQVSERSIQRARWLHGSVPRRLQ